MAFVNAMCKRNFLLDERRDDDEDEERQGQVAERENRQEVEGLRGLPLEPDLAVTVERERCKAEDDSKPEDVSLHLTHLDRSEKARLFQYKILFLAI